MSIRLPFATDHRTGHFIKQFAGPGEDTEIVCFKFWQLVLAWGCPFRCSYCFLQGLPWARVNTHVLAGAIFRNWRKLLDEVDEWLTARTPRTIIAGELQDGLVFDHAYLKMTGLPLTHRLIPPFASQQRHRLIFLTKSTMVKHALKLEPTPQVVFSWSVNAAYTARRWEDGAPSPKGRLAAARMMKEAGWRVCIRLDPMIPYADGAEHWRDGYARVIDEINDLGPEMVTLGALRATEKNALRAAAAKNGRPAEIFDYLSEKDPSGFKYRLPREQHLELFRFALNRLSVGRIVPALCKEDASVWDALGMKFKGCHCLLAGDRVADELVTSPGFRKLL